jgi:hypothetical protein
MFEIQNRPGNGCSLEKTMPAKSQLWLHAAQMQTHSYCCSFMILFIMRVR